MEPHDDSIADVQHIDVPHVLSFVAPAVGSPWVIATWTLSSGGAKPYFSGGGMSE
jgi:hypothetical protein